MNQFAGSLGQFVGALLDPINFALIAIVAYVARDKDGEWYHAVLVTGVVILFGIYMTQGRGMGEQIAAKIVLGALTFYAVRAFRDKRWNVLR